VHGRESALHEPGFTVDVGTERARSRKDETDVVGYELGTEAQSPSANLAVIHAKTLRSSQRLIAPTVIAFAPQRYFHGHL
jgi:hypothetical protein